MYNKVYLLKLYFVIPILILTILSFPAEVLRSTPFTKNCRSDLYFFELALFDPIF
jgi:hypothetical protein